MIIYHDKSYLNFALDLIAHGYATEVLHSIRFRFEYTDAEKELNREERPKIDLLPAAERNDFFCKAALLRSNALFPVMDAISRTFVCYQYADDTRIPYDSDEWELFFWCNDLYISTNGGLSGRDYSYFTLSFNDRMTQMKRMELCNRLVDFLAKNFSDNEHLCVAVQYGITYAEQKLKNDAQSVAAEWNGRKCMYQGMIGKIVCTETGAFFKKKYAKNKGYMLMDIDILRLQWATEEQMSTYADKDGGNHG